MTAGQGFPEMRSEEEARTRRVDAMPPERDDGARWEADVLDLARRLAPPGAFLTPSGLCHAAEARGLVPHHPNRWGVVWARLRRHGFRRTAGEVASATATRNSARESVYVRDP